MKIGIPVWNSWVSPVFDTANKLLVVEIDQSREAGRSEEFIPEVMIPQRAKRVLDLGINVLICNAISLPLARILSAGGPQVIAWRSGPVEEIIKAYLDGRLSQPRFTMPGCFAEKDRTGNGPRRTGGGRGCKRRMIRHRFGKS